MKPALVGLVAMTLVSVQDEIDIGRQAHAQVRTQVPEVRDAPTAAYIRDIGARLVRHAPGPKYPYSFSAADYREINAFLKFSRDDEREADQVGLQIMRRAGSFTPTGHGDTEARRFPMFDLRVSVTPWPV